MFRRVPLFLGLAAVLGAGSAPKKTVAILYFDNHTGSADYDPLGKGISSMMISDLSAVPEIQLVERERMQDLVKEIELQHTKYFDSTTAVKVGKMVGAEYVVVGSFATVKPQMRIDTRVVRVETGEDREDRAGHGRQDKFFDLEQALADKLIDGLAWRCLRRNSASRRSKRRIASTRVDDGVVLAGARPLRPRDYNGAMVKMGPAVAASPNSVLLRVAYSEMKRARRRPPRTRRRTRSSPASAACSTAAV